MANKPKYGYLARAGLKPGDWFPCYFGHHKYVAKLLPDNQWVVLTGRDTWTFDLIRAYGETIPHNDAKAIFADLAGYGLTYRS